MLMFNTLLNTGTRRDDHGKGMNRNSHRQATCCAAVTAANDTGGCNGRSFP